MKAPLPRRDEAGAIAALRDLAVLDSAPDPEIDALTAVAASICEVPIALVSLIDTERQWVKANIGLPGAQEAPRALSFCAHAVHDPALFEIEDAREDERFFDNPFVTGDPSIRFYAGAPVTVRGNHRVGTVCVIDRRPRRLTDVQREVLRNLAIAVGKALESRAVARKLQEQIAATEERDRRLDFFTTSLPSVLSYWDSDGHCRFANRTHESWYGIHPDAMRGMHLRDFLRPGRYDETKPFIDRALGGERLEFERTTHCADGSQRELLVVYIPDIVEGRVVGFLAQLTDVTQLKTTSQSLQVEKAEMQRVIELQGRTAESLNNAQRLGRIGSWEADLATGVSVWSSEMYRITGRDPALPPPQLQDRFSYFVPESAERLREASAACRQSGMPYVLELDFWHQASGEQRSLETRGDAVRGADGRVIGMVGTIQDITERKRMTGALAQQHELSRTALQQLRQVTNNLPALISSLDTGERFRFANQLYGTWLGRDPETLIGTSLVELYGQATYDTFKAHVHRALGGERVDYARELPTLLGPRHVEVSLVPEVDAHGRVDGLFVMMIDATGRRDAEAALQQSERRLRMVADNIPALVTYLDHEQRYRFVNDFHANVFQRPPAKLIGRSMREVAGEVLYGEIAPHVALALSGQQVTFEGVFEAPERRYHYQSTYIPDIGPDGQVKGFYAMTFDITALKETQCRLDALARVDALTGLPNRRQFDERLPEAMARVRRNGTSLSLVFLDVDRFKQINDTLGHGVGDFVLREFATRLRRQVRVTDLVARIAGDEFVVLLEGIHEMNEIDKLVQKIVKAIRPPMRLEDGGSVDVTTSAGVALYHGEDRPAAALLAAADRALYEAKRRGRDGYALASEVPTTTAELASEG